MNLTTIYEETRQLVCRLEETKYKVVLSSMLEDALTVSGGNQRLSAVRQAVQKALEIVESQETDLIAGDNLEQNDCSKVITSRAIRLKLRLLLNGLSKVDLRDSSFVSAVASEFDAKSIPYSLIAPCADEAHWTLFQNRFPSTCWRLVDWSSVEDAVIFQYRNGADAAQFFDRCCNEFGLENADVFVTTSIIESNFMIALKDLRTGGCEIICDHHSDVLFIGENADWVFEIYHEGEGGYAKAPRPSYS